MPSASLIANLRTELTRALPFSRMEAVHVDLFIAGARQAYFAPGEVVLDPQRGVVNELHLVRRGSVRREAGTPRDDASFADATREAARFADATRDAARFADATREAARFADATREAARFEYAPGELFPIGAVLGGRAVTRRYVANEDCFCLLLSAADVQALAARSTPFADFLQHRVALLLEQSRRAFQAAHAQHALTEQSLEVKLGARHGKSAPGPHGNAVCLPPLSCSPETPLQDALGAIERRGVGSIVVTDAAGTPVGILTRHDVIGRVTLPQRALGTPIGDVMSTPIHTLSVEATLLDAALLMSRHGVRHVPVTERGRLVDIVSERDLFALQRLSLKQLGAELRAAPDVSALTVLAPQIRALARNLLSQGVHARQLTGLISHLNDVLTARLVTLLAAAHGRDLEQACWLAFGSEGRSEQTVATDQDNGLVFVSHATDAAGLERDRAAWLALARAVNHALDACGYPLCKGNVMASNPACCLTPAEWQQHFERWIERGTPEDLLKASIYFDLRPLCGNPSLAMPLRELVTREAARSARFQRQLAENALQQPSPLNWRGALDTTEHDGRPTFDLKRQGTAIFVEGARLYALAHGVTALGTRERIEQVARTLGVPGSEAEATASGFEFLQMLRLQLQLGAAPQPEVNPNQIDVSTLNDIDLRMLKESCRMAQRLQQRLGLDYLR